MRAYVMITGAIFGLLAVNRIALLPHFAIALGLASSALWIGCALFGFGEWFLGSWVAKVSLARYGCFFAAGVLLYAAGQAISAWRWKILLGPVQLQASYPRLLSFYFTGMFFNLFLPSLAHIAEEFEADYGLVNLSIAGYAAVTAVLQLVMGPLSDRFGRRPVILAVLGVFVAASLGCALARDVETFLLFRMLQAAIISGYTISLAVIRDTAPKSPASAARAMASRCGSIAPCSPSSIPSSSRPAASLAGA